MAFSTIIFDLDGTLIDSRYDLAFAVNDMLDSYHLAHLPVETIVGFVGDGISNLVHRSLKASGGGGIDPGEALRIFQESYGEHLLDRTTLYPSVPEMLVALKGRRKAILTNKSFRFIAPILTGLGIADHFDLCVGGDTLPWMKPAPETIWHVMEKLGSRREDTIIIGDGATDILAGKGAAIATCAVLYGYGSEKALRALEPDLIAGDGTEIFSLIERVVGPK